MRVSNFYEINIKVYIAGIQVPCLSVGINSAFNAPAAATIALPPDSSLYGIGRYDRVPVQIFIRNTFGSASSDFILIFDGEIDSFGYSSTSLGREISINARSSMYFLNDVRVHLLNSLNDYAMASLPAEGLASLGAKTSGITFPASLLTKGIVDVDKNKMITCPHEFIDNIGTYLDLMAGKKFNLYDTALGEFYGKYAQKINFKNRYPKLPIYDDESSWSGACFPILKGMQTESILKLMCGVINEQNIGTLTGFLNNIANNMEYEVSYPFAAKYDESENKLYSLVFKPVFYDALPPACNIIYRSHVESIQASERVHNLPTRIRIKDLSGPLSLIVKQDQSFLSQFGLIDYFPTEYNRFKKDEKAGAKNWFATELFNSEEYTGPYLHDTLSPKWFSYVQLNDGASWDEYKKIMMAHMFRLKTYESRVINITTAFNPYISVGYPGVVFDSADSDFSFAGHIVSISHQLSKGIASSTVAMSFCRPLSDEINDPMKHGMDDISAINRDKTKTSEIYEKILGCKSVDFKDINSGMSAHGDPLQAYDANVRKICTFDQFLSFIGASGTKGGGSEITGDYFSKRKNTGLRQTLKDMTAKFTANEIYGDPSGK